MGLSLSLSLSHSDLGVCKMLGLKRWRRTTTINHRDIGVEYAPVIAVPIITTRFTLSVLLRVYPQVLPAV